MKKLVVCNQKMLLARDEAKLLRKALDDVDLSKINFIVCPSYINLDVFKGYNLGAQDAFYEDKGTFTGEISAYQLSLLNVKFVIIGHSERRMFDNEKVINAKVKAVLRNSMTPILCVGETKTDKSLRRTSEVIKRQLETALSGVVLDDTQEIIIAYEPVWAIGSGKCMQKEDIEDTILYIKKILSMLEISNYKIIYGGSITPKTIENIRNELVDGYLIGNSSVVLDDLNMIIKCIK